MLKPNERLCKCGCGDIINTDMHDSSFVIVKNLHRNSYYQISHYRYKIEQKLIKGYQKHGVGNLTINKEDIDDVIKFQIEIDSIEIK